MKLVVDASVLIKAYIPEAGAKSAGLLLRQAAAAETDLNAPELILPETANILWKKVRRKELTPAEAREIAEAIRGLPMRISPGAPIHLLALDIALECGITAYDAQYVALAEIFDCQLVTADGKLAAFLAGTGFSHRIRLLDEN